MLKDEKRPRDAFAFSLGGMRTITSFAIALAIADDRFRQNRKSEIADIQEDQPTTPEDQPGPQGRFWLSRRRRAA